MAQCPTLTAYGDTTICGSGTAPLNASAGFSTYTWSPGTGLSSTSIPNPVATVTGPTTYILTATGYGPNLIPNPDFSLGYVGFTSGHFYSPSYAPGNVFVGSGYFIYTTLTDHTPTIDNFMFQVDGATFSTHLYETTIPVTPNTNYDFSFWGSDADANQPTYEIHFIGNVTGDVVVATYPGIPYTGVWNWSQYTVPLWNSGLNTSMTIRINNLNLAGYGNDFGMDDFMFRTICTETDTVTIQTGLALAAISGPTTICLGQTASLMASGGGFFNWNTGSTSANISVNPAATTTYSVIVSDATGCSDTIAHTVNVLPIPVAAIAGNTNVCEGSSTTLTGSGGTSYVWNNGQTTNAIVASPLSTTTYILTVSNGACSDTASLTLAVVPVPAPPLVTDTTVCLYSNSILNATGNNITWYLSPGTTGSPEPFVAPTDATGDFNFYATQTVNGCESDEALLEVVVLAPPLFDIGNDQTLCSDQTILIGPQDNLYNYVWMDGLTTTPREVEMSNMYALSATNQCGTYTDAVTITFQPCECFFYIPNSFTPNVDGLNEVFKPLYDCSIKDYSFLVFDRWGEIVFETDSPSNGWDGTYKDILSKEDVYVYKVKFTAIKGSVEELQEYRGHVTLLK